MSNLRVAEIVLDGTIPSKKNSRNNLPNGVSLPSKEFVQWQKDALPIVRQQTRERFLGHIQIELILYFGTLGRADTDNKVTSILDMLVEALVLRDDYWETVADTHYQAAYRPGKSGAFIRITELPSDFFGLEYLEASEKRNRRNKR